MRKVAVVGYYLPSTEVIHLLGVSRKMRGAVDSEVNFFRSRQLFFRKHYPVRFPLFKADLSQILLLVIFDSADTAVVPGSVRARA